MQENNILVSVIMSEYNTDLKLLKESIQSILDQTFKDFEFIIIDDCSTNNVKEIVKEFNDERIKVFKNDVNCGLVFSLNKALSLSNGKYIARMDTDDFSYPDRLKKEIEFLENNKEYDVVGANVDYYDGIEIWGKSNAFGEISKKNFLNGTPISHPTVMLRREAILDIGGYLNYNRCEDYATWIELFVKGSKFYILKDKLVRYHLSLDDYKKRDIKKRKDFFKMLKEEYIKLKPNKSQLIKIYLKNIVAGLISSNAMYKYHKRKFSKYG